MKSPAALSSVTRIRHLDTLKGIGLLFVISGHTPWADRTVASYLYSFHMPLFFWVSGYLAATDGARPFPSFFARRCRTLLLPYFVFFWIAALWGLVLSPLLARGTVAPIPYSELLAALLLSGGRLTIIPGFPLWFLPCLFATGLLFFLVRRLKPNWLQAAVLIATAAATVPFQNRFPGRPPFHFNVIPAALVFMGIGYLWRRHEMQLARLCLPVGLVWIVALLLFSRNQGANISLILRPHYYFASAACSIFVYLEIARKLESLSLLRYVGEHSLFFYGLHAVVIDLLHGSGLFDRLTAKLKLAVSGTFAGHFLSVALTVFLLWSASVVYEKTIKLKALGNQRTSP